MTDGYFKIINQDESEIHVKAIYWNLGYCTDGDFNSLTVEFDYFNDDPPNFPNKIFMVETSRWLVEESSISNLDIDYISSKVKLLIHFHSKIMRGDDMERVKKKLKRKNTINNILKRKK